MKKQIKIILRAVVERIYVIDAEDNSLEIRNNLENEFQDLTIGSCLIDGIKLQSKIINLNENCGCNCHKSDLTRNEDCCNCKKFKRKK